MKLGIFSDTVLASSPEATAERTLMAGVEVVQLRLDWPGLNLLESASDRRCIRRAYTVVGIEIAALAVYTNLLDPQPEKRRANRHYFERALEVAAELGTRKLVTGTGTYETTDQWADHAQNRTPEAWDELLTVTYEITQRCKQAGVELVYEPSVNSVVSSALLARRLADEIRSDALSFVFDPASLTRAETIAHNRAMTQEALTLLRGYIGLVHAKDVRYDKHSQPNWLPLGSGVLDADSVISGLLEIDYDGALIVEHLAADQVSETLEFCRKRLPCLELA